MNYLLSYICCINFDRKRFSINLLILKTSINP